MLQSIYRQVMKIFSFFSKTKNHLTRLGENEPLSFLSIALIIGLDIFVLSTLFQGMEFQSSQVPSPHEVIPYDCQNIVDIEEEPSDYETRLIIHVLDRDTEYYATDTYKYSTNLINEAKNQDIDPKCRDIFDAALALRNDADVQNSTTEIENLQSQRYTLTGTIQQRQQDYDTMLLERIADQPEEDSIIEGSAGEVKAEITGQQQQVSNIDARIAALYDSIVKSPAGKNYLAAVVNNKDAINDRLTYLRYWYPLKDLLMKLVFLIPLFAFFCWFYRRSIARKSELLILISAHMLVVTVIPIILYAIDFAIDVLPFHFLKDLLELLKALNLIMLWSYLLIFLGIGITIALVYFIQKRFFSRERLQLKRIANQQCHACGAHLHHTYEYCFKCGSEQLIKCTQCKHPTFAKGKHCTHCGSEEFMKSAQ